MHLKTLIACGVIVIIAGGILYNANQSASTDPYDEPTALSSDFVLAPVGGGKFNVGEEIKAGFTMTYKGDHEKKAVEGSRFFVDEATVFATANSEAVSPYGKASVPVYGTASLDGEVMQFDLTGYYCTKADYVSIMFRDIVTRFDIEGVPQTDNEGSDIFWANDVHVSVECVAEQEMIQIDPPTLTIPAGQSPIGYNEAEYGYKHEDGEFYYNGERVDRDGEGSIIDDIR